MTVLKIVAQELAVCLLLSVSDKSPICFLLSPHARLSRVKSSCHFFPIKTKVAKVEKPTALTIDYRQDRLFWISQTNGVIECASLDGSNRSIVYQPITWSHGLTMVRKITSQVSSFPHHYFHISYRSRITELVGPSTTWLNLSSFYQPT